MGKNEKLRTYSLKLLIGFSVAFNPIWGDTIYEDIQLSGTDSASGDEFGHSVSIDNGVAAIGAPFDDTGVIKGKIIDIDNQLPLTGANIVVKSTSIGGVSDDEGYFSIKDIPYGNYTIILSYIGYKTEYLVDVWVRPHAYDFLNVELERSIIEIDYVVVENNFFKKSMVDEFQSVSFNRDDIRRSPGSGQEITRIINTLPSVASVGENSQDMMVLLK